MINEVLDLSRIESGDLAVSSEPVEFEGVINQAIGLVQPIADAAGISVEVLGLTCHTAYAQADRQRLLQVLINLLSNAVKYNRQQGRVTLQCFATPHNTVRIEVADTGYGISLEDQELLFQPFQRFGDSGIEGSGLGLALSRRFALLMGGKLGLATSSPLGSTFFIELKMVDSIEQPLVLQEQDSSSWNLLTKRQGTILYIEDNTSNIALLENLFSTCPMISLITVENGTLGIELARKHHPDVILLDLHLPDLMGDIVLERLKSDPETDSIPVVFLSADATNRQITKMISAGAVDYLTKPIDLLRLFQLLNDLLD
jgi:CheY-like chemotaxis protein/anti-sigma regulatory factor (Ser/Thr protein kinase)